MQESIRDNYSHRRYNALSGEWVLVSPHRSKRPWQGKVEDLPNTNRPTYDPKCYLCPGNTRINGEVNPQYEGTYAFSNDFAALQLDIPSVKEEEEKEPESFFVAKTEKGLCRVICFSPDHSLTLPKMEVKAIRKVVDLWTEEYLTLGAKPEINYVQIFENKGAMMGCSNPHPHGQIWAQQSLSTLVAKEDEAQKKYYAKNGRTLLEDYLQEELKAEERIICSNENFVALVPFWAVWPYESMIVSKRAIAHLGELTSEEKNAYAQILKTLTQKYDLIFKTSFPYSAGIHQAPTDGQVHPEWHLHMHFYPPLLRSATVKKFMVGYEMLGEPQRDITAEYSAKILRELVL